MLSPFTLSADDFADNRQDLLNRGIELCIRLDYRNIKNALIGRIKNDDVIPLKNRMTVYHIARFLQKALKNVLDFTRVIFDERVIRRINGIDGDRREILIRELQRMITMPIEGLQEMKYIFYDTYRRICL
jgi:hypothetical protein